MHNRTRAIVTFLYPRRNTPELRDRLLLRPHDKRRCRKYDTINHNYEPLYIEAVKLYTVENEQFSRHY